MSDDAGARPQGRLTRRAVIGTIAAGVPVIAGAAALPAGVPRVDAIAFDGFPIFDPTSVGRFAETALPGVGTALAAAWTTKLFGYTWLYTAAGQYAGFDRLADDSLRHVADTLGIALSGQDRARLVGAYAQLAVWPDVKPALARLRAAGVRLAFLSNLGEATLRENMARNGIEPAFEHVLSTDRVGRFKPAREAYAMALQAFDLPLHRIGFAAFGGWDAAGAAWFGYRTAWVNRLGVRREAIDPGPAITGPDMQAVLALAGLA